MYHLCQLQQKFEKIEKTCDVHKSLHTTLAPLDLSANKCKQNSEKLAYYLRPVRSNPYLSLPNTRELNFTRLNFAVGMSFLPYPPTRLKKRMQFCLNTYSMHYCLTLLQSHHFGRQCSLVRICEIPRRKNGVFLYNQNVPAFGAF